MQLNVIPAAMPEITRVRQQVVNLIRRAGLDAELGQVQIHPADLDVMRVEIDDRENEVVLSLSRSCCRR